MNGNLKAKVRIRVRDGKDLLSRTEINSKDKGLGRLKSQIVIKRF